jgi:hypothetical protein
MNDGTPRARPDGSAWQEAQRKVADRNDEARKRGREERAQTDRRDAKKRSDAERGGIYR